jgi:glycosyltransferase 2 family protein
MTRLIRRLVRPIVSLSLLALLLSQIELGESLQAIAGARLDLLGLLLLVVIIDRVLAAYRWYVLVRGMAPTVTFGSIIRLTLVSGFVGYFMPGTIGVEIVRAYGLASRTSNALLSITSVLVERLLALLALVLLMVIGLAFQPPGLPAEVVRLAGVGLALVLSGVLALMLTPFRRSALLLLAPLWLAPARRGLQKLYGALDEYARQRRLMLWSAIIALLVQLIRCLQPAIAAAALGTVLPFSAFVTFVPMVILITLVPISLGGLGVQDISFVYLLGLAGMSAEIALSLSLLLHICVLLSNVPGAWLYARHGARG